MREFKGSLFERLNSDFNLKEFEDKEHAIQKSIANNLSRIFSINAGGCEIALDYGKPDLNNIDLTIEESIRSIEYDCKQNIIKYEPRLYNPQVFVSKEGLIQNEMNIIIEGDFFVNKKRVTASFRANLLKNGKIKIYKTQD